ncbi:hypothetical protein D3C87_1920240 [compost metagenome]
MCDGIFKNTLVILVLDAAFLTSLVHGHTCVRVVYALDHKPLLLLGTDHIHLFAHKFIVRPCDLHQVRTSCFQPFDHFG